MKKTKVVHTRPEGMTDPEWEAYCRRNGLVSAVMTPELASKLEAYGFTGDAATGPIKSVRQAGTLPVGTAPGNRRARRAAAAARRGEVRKAIGS